jgi:hypothetical protein
MVVVNVQSNPVFAVSEEKNTAAAAASAAPDVAEDKSEKNAEKKGENSHTYRTT